MGEPSPCDRCATCGKWSWRARHTCPPRWEVRVKGDDWREIYASDPEVAAETYCDEFDGEMHEYGIIRSGSAIVEVRAAGTKTAVEFSIEAESVPQYRATEIAP